MSVPWVQTRHGVAFDLLSPREEDVRLGDVAHGLARIARFSGATVGPVGYSVAQHSLLVADILQVWGADTRLQIEGLLHDAGEAYYGDVTSPVQRAMRDLHRQTIEAACAEYASTWEGRGTSDQAVAVQDALALLAAYLRDADPLRELKRRVDPVVRAAFGLPADEHHLVKRADLVALAIERKLLMTACDREWELPELADTRWTSLEPMRARDVEDKFVARFNELGGECAR